MRSATVCLGILLLVTVACLVGRSHQQAKIDGTNYNTIQDAIDASSSQDTIEIDPGTYTGTGFVNLVITHPLTLKSSTVNPSDVILDCEGAYACTLIFISDTDNVSIIGLTLQGGNTTLGGGVFASGAVATFTNIVAKNNVAIYGGVACGGLRSAVTFTDSTFIDNSANFGGAVAHGEGVDWIFKRCTMTNNKGTQQNNVGVFNSGGSVEIHDSVMTGTMLAAVSASIKVFNTRMTDNNRSSAMGGQGGAIFARGLSHFELDGCYFARNEAEFGAAIDVASANVFKVSRSIFEKNTGTRVVIHIITLPPLTVNEVTDCVFKDNSLNRDTGLYIEGQTLGQEFQVKNCTFSGNNGPLLNVARIAVTLEDSTMFDNAVHDGESCVIIDQGTLRVVNSEFKDNTNNGNGLIRILPGFHSTLNITNSRFEGNVAENGGVAYMEAENVTVTVDDDSVFKDNKAVNNGGVFYWKSLHNGDGHIGGKYTNNKASKAGGVAFFDTGSWRPSSNECHDHMDCDGNDAAYGDEYATGPYRSHMKGKTPKKARNLKEIELTLSVEDELGNDVVDDSIQISNQILPQDGMLVDLNEENGNSGTVLTPFTLKDGKVKIKVSVVGEFNQKYEVFFVMGDRALETHSFETQVVGCDDNDEYKEFYPPGISRYSVCKDNNYHDTTDTQDVLTWVYGSIAAISIIICLLSTLVIIVFRDRRVMNFASPLFCCIMQAGLILCFASIFPFIVEANDVACKFFPVLLLLGFGMVFGPLIAKIYRVWNLYNCDSFEKLRVSDLNLLKFVAAVVGLEVACIIVVLAAGQPHWEYTNLDDDDSSGEAHNYVKQCEISHTVAVLATVFAVNGIILFITIVFAFLTRGVAAGLNDARAVGIITYSIAFISALFIPLVVVKNEHDFTLALIGLGVLLGLWIVWLVLFAPKFWTLITGADLSDDWGHEGPIYYSSKTKTPGGDRVTSGDSTKKTFK
eukprot:TRINITY_DN17425_c0_g1_i1.p1 TRINITY_DN17425_c0_g1~~TRINITY_DN17425_c0_g1_i1.p1  ORF type:complete len:969 (+),score=254.60 TRINITY_DN17425_c0_g1_i1:351-3257(+)